MSLLVDAWNEVFDRNRSKLFEAAHKERGNRVLELDYFKDVCLVSRTLRDLSPGEWKTAWEIGQQTLDGHEEAEGVQLALALTNLGEGFTQALHNVGSEDYGDLLQVVGIIRNISNVRERIACAAHECQRCGHVVYAEQPYDIPGNKKLEPAGCPQCEKNTTWRLDPINTVLEDQRVMTLSSPIHQQGPDRRLPVLVHRDLVHRCEPGEEVEVIAFKDLERESKKNTHRPFLVAVNVRRVRERTAARVAEKNHIEEWRQLIVREDFEDLLIDAISPHFHGHESARKALALTLFSSPRKDDKRGDLNILLAGSPGTGKSDLLRHMHKVAPRSVTANGSSDTGVGLTAAAVQDELMGGWTVQSGALPLASGGLCLIDELDKASKDDAEKILEAAEDQQISFNRAGINTTLRAEASIVAAANPREGRWTDNQEPSIHQLDILPPLLSRFDGIFLFQDRPNNDRDGSVADAVLDAHEGGKEFENPVTRDLITRMSWYARENIDVHLTRAARDRFKDAYLDLRGRGVEVGIGPRQLESMVRFAKARARLYLRAEVSIEDAEWSTSLVKGWIENASRGPRGVVDITHIDDPQKASQRELVGMIAACLKELDEGEGVPISTIAEDTGIPTDRVRSLLSLMGKNGDVYSPQDKKYKAIQ